MQALIFGWLASHWLLVALVVFAIACITNPVTVWKFKAWILCAAIGWWGWTGHAAYDALVLKNTLAENAALTQAIADNAKANDERRAAQKEVDRLATLPPKVVTVVRNHPSKCDLPRPVTDSVRDQVRETNSAIKAAVR
jgi:hypothetical protein